MDEDLELENALFPWLDDESHDKGGDYDDPPEFDDEDDEEYDEELARDQLLERQELEDFEGLNGPFEDYNDGGDW